MAVLEKQTPTASSFPAFTAELKWVSDHPVQSGEVASHILSLNQDSSSVADYLSGSANLRPGAAGMTQPSGGFATKHSWRN